MDNMPTFDQMALAVATLVTLVIGMVATAIALTVVVKALEKNAPWIPRALSWVWDRLVGGPYAEYRSRQIKSAVEPMIDEMKSEMAKVAATVEHINGAVNNVPPGEPTLSQIVRQTHYVALGHTNQLVELSGRFDDLEERQSTAEASLAEVIADLRRHIAETVPSSD